MNNKCSIFINEVEVNYRTDADNGYEAFCLDPEDLFKEVIIPNDGLKPSEVILKLIKNGRYDIVFGFATKGFNAFSDELEQVAKEFAKSGGLND